MIPEDFSKALLRSARNDAPLDNGKARLLAHVVQTLGGGGAAGAAGVTVAAQAMTTAKVAAALALVAVAAGAGGYALAPAPSKPVERASDVTLASRGPFSTPIGAAPVPGPLVAAAKALETAPVATDMCTPIPEAAPAKCSTAGGHTVTLALRSTCTTTTVDIFWVDFKCQEVFSGVLAPGETWNQETWDSHPFRLRDHATHRLVKEFVAPQVAGAPDREKYLKGPPTELPVVVIREGDAPIAEAPPPECTRGGGRAATLHVRNERKDGGMLALVTVDSKCKESPQVWRVEPGAAFDMPTSEGSAFRIRDASGALLADVLPTSLDTTTYLTVP